MMETLYLCQLLIDFGLVILIFMVQLTIYPSFRFYEKENLVRWHQQYTGAIAMVVAPLMLSQLALAFYMLIVTQQYFIACFHLLLVLATWVSTAVQFVPIHNRIGKNEHRDEDLKHLVQRNWLRVMLWSVIFIVSLVQYVRLHY